MKNIIKHSLWILLLLLPCSAYAWHWRDLWQTPDQQGKQLLQNGKAKEASEVFKNKDWKGVALYRSGDYSQAFQTFSGKKTSDNQYNAGNAAAYQGNYQEALDAYDKALALNPNNQDAMSNRDLVKKLLQKQQQEQDKQTESNNSQNKQDAGKTQANNNSSSQQDQGKDNSSPDKNAEKKNSQNNSAKDGKQGENQQAQANNDEQTTAGQKPNSKQQDEATNSENIRPPEEVEAKKQILRRIADNPGGLLQRKFLRDYEHRHDVGDNSNSENN